MRFAILKGHEVIEEKNLDVWGKWFEKTDRHVGKDKIGDTLISTIFLGMDHSFESGRAPLWFETMVFGGPLDGAMARYETYDQAMSGHSKMVDRVSREIIKVR